MLNRLYINKQYLVGWYDMYSSKGVFIVYGCRGRLSCIDELGKLTIKQHKQASKRYFTDK